MKTNKKQLLTYVFGAFLLIMGVLHFVYPAPFLPMIPETLPQKSLNILGGLVEIILGLGVFFSSSKKNATLGIFFLMILFLPLHFIDIFRTPPAIGSLTIALIRFPLQFVLIYWAWYIHKTTKS